MHKNKAIRIVAITVLALALLVLATNYLLSNYLERKITDNYLSGYHITGKDASVNLFSRSVSIIDVLVTDSVPGERKIFIPELQVKGISFYNLLFNKKYEANEIKILNPEITYINKKDTTPEVKEKPSKIQLLIKKTEILNAKILMLKADSGMHDTVMYQTMGLDVWDLTLGDPSGEFQYKNFGISRVALNVEQGVFYMPDGLYRLQSDELHYDSKDSLFTIEKLQLLTNFSKYGIGEYAETQRDWLHITLDKISLSQIDASLFLKDTILKLNTLEIAYLDVNTFKDRRLPFPEKPNSKLPMATIDDFPFKLHCDSLNIVDGHIEYSERAPKSSKEGHITFEGLTAHAENVSNIAESIFGKTIMHASAKVMGKTKLDADFVFPNIKYPEPYKTSGHLNPVAIAHFNPILIQALGAEIRSGQLNNLWFNFSYNDDISTGSMIFEYEDLKVDMIEREEMEKNNVTSFLVNALAIKNKNIRGEKKFKEGKISFERDKRKAIFNYWWKSIMTGFMDTATPG